MKKCFQAKGVCTITAHTPLSATLVWQLSHYLFRETCFMNSYPIGVLFCGASGDTAFFKKHSNINGFRTPEQRNYLYSALLKPSISAAIARFISR